MKQSNLASQLAALTSDDPLIKLADALPLLCIAHRSTAMRWHKAGKLHLVKIGSQYRIRLSELLRVSEGRMQQCLEPAPSAEISSVR